MEDRIPVGNNSMTKEDKAKLRKAILEINDSLTRVEAERDLQKEIINKMNEELGMDKKIIRRMARVYHNANYSAEVQNNRDFEETYDGVMK